MANQFSSGKNSIAACDRCGFRFRLRELRSETVKLKRVNNMVCPQCFDPDHPQLQLGMYPVQDPQAVRNARPDRGYTVGGPTVDGSLSAGSRIYAWGWAPVGGGLASSDTPNPLAIQVRVGTITVYTT